MSLCVSGCVNVLRVPFISYPLVGERRRKTKTILLDFSSPSGFRNSTDVVLSQHRFPHARLCVHLKTRYRSYQQIFFFIEPYEFESSVDRFRPTRWLIRAFQVAGGHKRSDFPITFAYNEPPQNSHADAIHRLPNWKRAQVSEISRLLPCPRILTRFFPLHPQWIFTRVRWMRIPPF